VEQCLSPSGQNPGPSIAEAKFLRAESEAGADFLRVEVLVDNALWKGGKFLLIRHGII
jgi:hypothetical protein